MVPRGVSDDGGRHVTTAVRPRALWQAAGVLVRPLHAVPPHLGLRLLSLMARSLLILSPVAQASPHLSPRMLGTPKDPPRSTRHHPKLNRPSSISAVCNLAARSPSLPLPVARACPGAGRGGVCPSQVLPRPVAG